MRRFNSKKGFTLIEILLVVTIMGIMLAIIVPRAWRANTDAKYGVLRQHATEISSFSVQWAEDQLRSQDDHLPTGAAGASGDLAGLADYIAYLAGVDGFGGIGATFQAEWVSTTTTTVNVTNSRGFSVADQTTGTLDGRYVAGATAPAAPSGPAAALVPQEKIMRNPFTGQDVLDVEGDNPGAMTIAVAIDNTDYVYATVVFQGVDDPDGATFAANAAAYYGCGTINEETMRSGMFMARYKEM